MQKCFHPISLRLPESICPLSYLPILVVVLVQESLPPVLDAGLDVLGGHHAGTVPGKREMDKCKYLMYKYISLNIHISNYLGSPPPEGNLIWLPGDQDDEFVIVLVLVVSQIYLEISNTPEV